MSDWKSKRKKIPTKIWASGDAGICFQATISGQMGLIEVSSAERGQNRVILPSALLQAIKCVTAPPPAPQFATPPQNLCNGPINKIHPLKLRNAGAPPDGARIPFTVHQAFLLSEIISEKHKNKVSSLVLFVGGSRLGTLQLNDFKG